MRDPVTTISSSAELLACGAGAFAGATEAALSDVVCASAPVAASAAPIAEVDRTMRIIMRVRGRFI
jgi:uncharacterized membrane protein YadS